MRRLLRDGELELHVFFDGKPIQIFCIRARGLPIGLTGVKRQDLPIVVLSLGQRDADRVVLGLLGFNQLFVVVVDEDFVVVRSRIGFPFEFYVGVAGIRGNDVVAVFRRDDLGRKKLDVKRRGRAPVRSALVI